MAKSRLQTDYEHCYLCGKAAPLDVHHIFNGAYRKRSTEDSMVILVCRWCHIYLHENPKQARLLKAKAQRILEESMTRDEFIKRYGKSYL
jgi:hypothetical protein